MTMYVQAVEDKVVVELMTLKDNVTAGGIIIPDTVEKDPQKYGKVVSVGEKVSGINVGDILLFAKFGGQDIIIENKIFRVLGLPEIYGILKEN